MGFEIFDKKKIDHIMHEEYLEAQSRSRHKFICRLIGVSLALLLAKILWG